MERNHYEYRIVSPDGTPGRPITDRRAITRAIGDGRVEGRLVGAWSRVLPAPAEGFRVEACVMATGMFGRTVTLTPAGNVADVMKAFEALRVSLAHGPLPLREAHAAYRRVGDWKAVATAGRE